MTAFTEDWLREHQAKIARGRNTVPAPAPRLIDRDRPSVGCPVVAGEPQVKAKRQRPEEKLQLAVAELLDWGLPPGYKWFHTPNQRGTRALWENKLLKALGVKEGVFDVTILTPQGRFIAIELKSTDGSLSKPQREWRDWCKGIGAPWFLCRSIDDVIEALESLQIRLKVRA